MRVFGVRRPPAGTGCAGDHAQLMLDPQRDELIQAQRARHIVDDGQHVAAEGVLQGGVLVQVVHHDARLGVALQYDDDPQAGSGGGVVTDVGDAGELAGVHQVGDALGEVDEAFKLAGKLPDLEYKGVYVLDVMKESTFKNVLHIADTVTGVTSKVSKSSRH